MKTLTLTLTRMWLYGASIIKHVNKNWTHTSKKSFRSGSHFIVTERSPNVHRTEWNPNPNIHTFDRKRTESSGTLTGEQGARSCKPIPIPQTIGGAWAARSFAASRGWGADPEAVPTEGVTLGSGRRVWRRTGIQTCSYWLVKQRHRRFRERETVAALMSQVPRNCLRLNPSCLSYSETMNADGVEGSRSRWKDWGQQ